MLNKLHIESTKDIKIIKIKDWSISFKNKDRFYLLHISSEDYETAVTLYEKIYDNKKCKLDFIKNEYSGGSFYNDLLRKTDKNKVYKHLDLDFFVKRMTYNGFCTSYFNDKIIRHEISLYEQDIKGMQDIISRHQDHIRKLRFFE